MVVLIWFGWTAGQDPEKTEAATWLPVGGGNEDGMGHQMDGTADSQMTRGRAEYLYMGFYNV
jgi:hypothetical protein